MYAPRAEGGRRRAGQSRQTAAGTTSRARAVQPRPAAPGLVRRVWGVLARAVSFGGAATTKGRGRVAPAANSGSGRKHTERNRSQMRTLEADLDDIKREIQVIKKEKREKRVRIMSPATEPKAAFSMGAIASPMATKSFAREEDCGHMTISSLSFLCEATPVVVRKPSLMIDA